MGSVQQAVGFAAGLYRQRAAIAVHGYLRRDPLAQLDLHIGRRDPYPVYERIRAGGPLWPTRLGNWATTSHSVCSTVLRDRRFGARAADAAAGGGDGFDLSFLEMNPPDHTRLRRLVTPAFSPRRMAGYRASVETTVHRLLDDAGDEFDLVGDVATPLPIAVITDLLGVPAERCDAFAHYGAVIGSALDGVRGLRHVRELIAANTALETLFQELFEARRRAPADDVISAIVAAEGDQVQPREMVPLCVLLLIAGFETTVNLISNAVLALLTHRSQWDALCADPSLAAAAIEETLRWDPPVQRTSRFALEDVELGGVPVRKNQVVITLLGGANRDPSTYEDPATFDITRERSVDHLAFSSGIHYCIGQPLARLEATIALQALAERRPGLRLSGRVARRKTSTIRGPLRLPVAGR